LEIALALTGQSPFDIDRWLRHQYPGGDCNSNQHSSSNLNAYFNEYCITLSICHHPNITDRHTHAGDFSMLAAIRNHIS
jgi:hypothetical protein